MISAHLELMKKNSGFVPTLDNIKPAIERTIAFSGIECDEEDKDKLLEEIEYRENSCWKLFLAILTGPLDSVIFQACMQWQI